MKSNVAQTVFFLAFSASILAGDPFMGDFSFEMLTEKASPPIWVSEPLKLGYRRVCNSSGDILVYSGRPGASQDILVGKPFSTDSHLRSLGSDGVPLPVGDRVLVRGATSAYLIEPGLSLREIAVPAEFLTANVAMLSVVRNSIYFCTVEDGPAPGPGALFGATPGAEVSSSVWRFEIGDQKAKMVCSLGFYAKEMVGVLNPDGLICSGSSGGGAYLAFFVPIHAQQASATALGGTNTFGFKSREDRFPPFSAGVHTVMLPQYLGKDHLAPTLFSNQSGAWTKLESLPGLPLSEEAYLVGYEDGKGNLAVLDGDECSVSYFRGDLKEHAWRKRLISFTNPAVDRCPGYVTDEYVVMARHGGVYVLGVGSGELIAFLPYSPSAKDPMGASLIWVPLDMMVTESGHVLCLVMDYEREKAVRIYGWKIGHSKE